MEYTYIHNHQSQFIEWFGDVEYIPLKNVCLRIGEYGSNTPATDYDGSVRYLRITDINDDGSLGNEIVSPSTIEEKYYLQTNDFVFARTGNTVGKTYLHTSGKMIYAGYLIRYKLDETCVLPKFLLAYTHTSLFWDWVSKMKKVGAQPNISAQQYNELPIPRAEIASQQRFVSIAEQADKSKFDGFKSQFIEMFGNPITGWKYPVTTLGDCFKIGTGGTPSRENSSFYDGIIPWVKSTEVNYNYINDTEEHLSKDGVDSSNCKLYPVGTVLMAMYGQGSTRGRVAVLEVPATVNQAIAAIQIYDEDESAFVFNILTILYSHIRDMAIGGNQKNLNLKLVSQIPYIKVPSYKRKEFAAIVRQADKSKYYEINET